MQNRGRKFEKRLAGIFNGNLVPGSGNKWHSKEDVNTEHFKIQAKSTSYESIILKKQDFVIGEKNAKNAGKMFAMALQINDLELIVLDMDWFEFIEEKLGNVLTDD